jgi:hypothetical protein
MIYFKTSNVSTKIDNTEDLENESFNQNQI